MLPRAVDDEETAFLSTLPARGATLGSMGNCKAEPFLSTLPARGATLQPYDSTTYTDISIHAPREGSDFSQCSHSSLFGQFLSTLPARGATVLIFFVFFAVLVFLSTLPARGATVGQNCGYASYVYFYPRSPRGERPTPFLYPAVCSGFLSTLPARGATGQSGHSGTSWYISIHAPREGSDLGIYAIKDTLAISIHAPREGSDERYTETGHPYLVFLSTLPARGATPTTIHEYFNLIFLSTLPARGATQVPGCTRVPLRFLSTLPARGATSPPDQFFQSGQFLSTLPARGATRQARLGMER